MSRIQVSSEIAPLRRVMVHRPDAGISRVSPKAAEELLFDDIVHLPRMQQEHDVFTAILRSFMGPTNVLETQELLRESLEVNDEARQEMLDLIVQWEELPTRFVAELGALPAGELAEILITGYYEREDHILFNPIPNFIFTRDIAVTVNDHLIITKANKVARMRENFLTRLIIWAHPIFAGLREPGRIINLNKVDEFPPSKRGETVSLEGGDAMILNKDYLLIGVSERTNAYGINSLAERLFNRGVINNIARVDIPADRSFMHLDTIFTQINNHDYVAYKPIIVDGLSSNVTVMRRDGKAGSYPSVADFLREEIDAESKFILSGGGQSPYQEREQWTDGCNLVSLRPGVAITYDRNPKTEAAFEAAGYRVVHSIDLLKAFEDGIIRPDEVKNTIITLPSSELSRARGGSHCMTCPIERA